MTEIGMTIKNARIECTAKRITHAFIHFKNDDERNKYIRSANMLRKERRGRKLKITRSMDAKERFHQNRMGYVRFCMHVKHNIPLDSITTNRALKHISVKRPDCGKDMPERKPKVHQIPRHWNRSRRTNGKNGKQKTHRNDCEQSREGQNRREEGRTTSSQLQTATQGNQ